MSSAEQLWTNLAQAGAASSYVDYYGLARAGPD